MDRIDAFFRDLDQAQAPTPATTPERSEEILTQIKHVFAEKGFDGASMQDLARAAGMSVGNFYRYFPSKDAIIEAMAAFDMAEMEADFALLQASDDPLSVIRAKILHKIEGCEGDGRLWAEITAAAQRKPEIARISCGVEDMVARNLTQVFERLTGRNDPASCDRIAAQTRFIVVLVKTAAMRRCSHGADPAVEALILKTIETVIADILSAERE